MRPTDLTLGEQLKMTEREIRRRQELFNITEQDIAAMVQLKPLIASVVDEIVDEFYNMQVDVDEIAQVIGDSETLSRLKKHMCRYILTLFDGEYGMDYVLSRLRIGLVHKRIGVPPKLYVPSFLNLFSRLRSSIVDRDKDCQTCVAKIASLEKFMFFDLEMVFDTYINSLMEELAKGRREIEQYAQSLEETVAQRTEELAVLARKDGLTSLLNQRSFYDELRREVSRTVRAQESITLVYFDLDGFKAVNDTYGHKRGDEILKGVAEVTLAVVRAEDIVSRYGGDEFCIILPHSGLAEAREVASRLIKLFDEKMADSGVTLSIGLAEASHDQLRDGDLLVKKADGAMYQAKKIQGHAIVVADAD
ncbi:MAG: GGDEF domain-containing protein [Desulfobulbaceae bacterium]|nr:GGDEF domain-containing protein [Desulfobulbaceae bacterium]HIJ79009.1 GGDEF domain-containing protein [Deltaproteobacteria bacterium]